MFLDGQIRETAKIILVILVGELRDEVAYFVFDAVGSGQFRLLLFKSTDDTCNGPSGDG